MKTVILMALILVCRASYAQIKPKNAIKVQLKHTVLKIGEKVPDIDLGEIVNYGNFLSKDKKVLKVSDFKGKLLILDFWGAYCSFCIQTFPKLEALQNQFGDQLCILPVSFAIQKDDGKKSRSVVPLIKSWKGTAREMGLPSTEVTEKENGLETHALRQLFPFDSFPTVIWIDQNGIFRGTTESEALTVNNIRGILSGKRLAFKQKKPLRSVNEVDNFLINRFRNNKMPVHGSAFSKYIDTLNWSYLELDTSNQQLYHFFAVNQPVNLLYEMAYGQLPIAALWKADQQKILIDSTFKLFYKNDTDMNRLDYWKKDSIYADNRFCYEAIYPRASFSIIDAWTLIVRDLDKYLGVQSGIESRNVSCMKLLKMNSEQIPVAFSQRFSTDEIILADKNKQAVINGRNLDDFIRRLNSMKPDLPAIINETGYNGEIGVAFNGEDFKDLNSIKATLQKNGLNLVAGTAKMNVLVLKRVR